MARASAKEVRLRTDFAEELLSSAMSPARVVQELKKEYGIKDRMAWIYVKKVQDRWNKEHDEQRPHRKEQLVATVERLYKECLDSGDKRTAAGVIDKLAKLEGTYPSDKQEIKHHHGGGLDINLDSRVMSEEYILQRLAELKDKK